MRYVVFHERDEAQTPVAFLDVEGERIVGAIRPDGRDGLPSSVGMLPYAWTSRGVPLAAYRRHNRGLVLKQVDLATAVVDLQQPGAVEPLGLAEARRPLLVGQAADDEVLEALALEVQMPQELARSFMRQARHVIDSLVADDVAVVDEGLVLAPQGQPVVDRLKGLLADPNWEPPEDLLEQDDARLAAALGLAVEVVERHRPASFSEILLRVLEREQLPEDSPQADMLYRLLAAWLDTFKQRRYFVSHIGREAHFEEWLIGNLDRITPYDLELLGRQWQSKDRKHRPDLICRVRKDGERLSTGTVLVVELKAGVANEQALTQLERYLPVVQAEFGSQQQTVAGMLVADGLVLGLEEELTRRGIGYASASELGYRDHLFAESKSPLATPSEPELEATTATHEQVLLQTSSGPGGLRRSGPWHVAGQAYATRRSANRALAGLLGSYTAEQWVQAQREHGLR